MFDWFQSLLPRTGDFFGMFEAMRRARGRRDALTAMVEAARRATTNPGDHQPRA